MVAERGMLRCQNIVYLQYRYRHVRIRKGRKRDSEGGGQLMFIQPLVL